MAVGGDDDTVASSLPTLDGSQTSVNESELVGGRYRLVRWLGGGGMGRVYEALDTELDERVALKVLRSGMSDDAIERFRREVKLTRRIQHRNVARMFDIGEHNGEKFLTMELVDGEPLTRQMGGGAMPWPKLKAYAEQICAGLTAAHEKGVIHRDLKPDNVLVERETDRAVLTDFGIARGGDDPSVTQVGAVVGTPRYMAPEQLAGREVDARADLFSLGVMLFELATATRPWGGDNAISIAVAQATSAPRTIDSQTDSVPQWFAQLVSACLQLEPDHRPASAAEVAAALVEGRPPVVSRERSVAAKLAAVTPAATPGPTRSKAPTGTTRAAATPTITEPTSIAVLPVTCAPADEYLADGLLEDLTDTLSTTPGLRVRPSGVVRHASVPDAREVGQKLQVDHVVASSLRRTPAGLRISTRLISVADGFQIWAHKTDCCEADVLNVADELARGVAEALSTRATSDTKPTDPRAVDLYLRARAELRRFWGSHAQSASDLLEQAVEYAPTSAPILAAAAYAAVQTWVMRAEGPYLPRAEAALARGLATGHGEAYLASAQFQFNRGQPEHAARDLARALVRAPMSAQTHELAAKILLEIDGPTVARQHYETARGLDPGRSSIIDNDLARVDGLEHRWPDADARLAKLLGDDDMSIKQLGLVSSARLAMWRGNSAIAMQTAKMFLSRVSPNAGAVFSLVGDLEKEGTVNRELWAHTLAESVTSDRPLRQHLIRMQLFSEIAIGLGELDLGMDALARAVDLGLIDKTWMDGCPLLAKVTAHPAYAGLRRTVGERASHILATFRSVVTSG